MDLIPLPHQERGHAELWQLIDAGAKRIIVEAPTGAGKTFMLSRDVLEAKRRSWPALIITNRKLLTRQAGANFDRWRIPYGYLASGFEAALLKDVQIGSFQTIHSRVIQRERADWRETLGRVKLAIVDEAHNNVNPTAKEVLQILVEAGAVIVGFTATPCDLEGYYTHKVVAGTNTELVRCGLHAVAVHYGPDEPDLKHVKRIKTGEYTEAGVVKAIMTQGVYARVIDEWRRLNPEGLPTLGFAPGVPEARGFVDAFRECGHTAEYIDADTEDDERDRIIADSKAGRCQVVWNRFVMREGVDMPWLRHIILATAFGTIKSYIQAGGRGKRACPGKRDVTIQDHGGHWHRFGDLNEDREWKLDDTSTEVQKRYDKPRTDGTEPQPICCPRCKFIRPSGARCPSCGHEHAKSTRNVIQSDGKLKRHFGPALKVVREEQRQQKAWTSALFAAAKLGQNFNQAMHLYKRKMGAWPPKHCTPMLPDSDTRQGVPVWQVWRFLDKARHDAWQAKRGSE